MFNFLFAERANSDNIDFQEVVPQSIGVFLINLDRSTDRLSFVKQYIDQLNMDVQRVSAVDGRLLDEDDVQKICDYERFKQLFNMLPERGTIGCSLSHEKVWNQFLKSNFEFALVFEDDVVFDPIELKKCLEEVIKHKFLWDIVSFEMNHRGMPVKVTELCDDKFLSVYLTSVKHSGCYIINRRAAKKLLDKFYPIIMPLDHYFTSSWEFDIKFMGVEPRVVKQGFGESQIKTESSKKFNSYKLKLKRAILNIRIGIINFLYNLMVWKSAKIS